MKNPNLFLLLSLSALASGCMGMQGQSTLDSMSDSVKGKPFVEAYIEYTGPQAKWAGPIPFVIHVVAKDSGNAQISVVPTPAQDGELKNRVPAGQGSGKQGMSGEMARDLLANLATTMETPQSEFQGCLYPVRVRLLRADGGLIEKQGCRSQLGWPRTASETASAFIGAAT